MHYPSLHVPVPGPTPHPSTVACWIRLKDADNRRVLSAAGANQRYALYSASYRPFRTKERVELQESAVHLSNISAAVGLAVCPTEMYIQTLFLTYEALIYTINCVNNHARQGALSCDSTLTLLLKQSVVTQACRCRCTI